MKEKLTRKLKAKLIAIAHKEFFFIYIGRVSIKNSKLIK